MGNWNITIRGVGCHHNGKPEIDADLQAKAFVVLLKKSGHTITSATITHGGETNLGDSSMDACANPSCGTLVSKGSPAFCPEHNDQNPISSGGHNEPRGEAVLHAMAVEKGRGTSK